VRHRTRLACLVLIAGTALAAAPRTPPPSPPAGPAPAARPGPFPTEEIVRILGAAGTWNQAERVYKVPFPRTDVPVSVDGWPLPPFMGLTSWVAFESAGGAQVMMMGDLVLFQDEVQDALGALLDTGAEVTALHNHFMFDDPRVFFMHVGGTGAPEKLAAAVQAAFEVVRARRAAQREPTAARAGDRSRRARWTGRALPRPWGSRGSRGTGCSRQSSGARHDTAALRLGPRWD